MVFFSRNEAPVREQRSQIFGCSTNHSDVEMISLMQIKLIFSSYKIRGQQDWKNVSM